jgi:hypothetical protein
MMIISLNPSSCNMFHQLSHSNPHILPTVYISVFCNFPTKKGEITYQHLIKQVVFITQKDCV